MTPPEAQMLLGIAASFDNRKPSEEAAVAWSHALEGLRFVDCRDAIVAHYRASNEWLMPAKVVAEVRRLRDKRIADHPPPTPPSSLDPDDTVAFARWQAQTRTAIADGTYAPEPVGELTARPVEALPLAGTDLRRALRAGASSGKAVRAAQAAAERQARDDHRAAQQAARDADRDARHEREEAS